MANYLIQDPRNATIDIYQAMLHRDPDPEGMARYTYMLEQQGLLKVLQEFLTCNEFQEFSLRGPDPTLNWGRKMPVDLDLTDVQMDQLWSHVSEVWTGLGISDPFWSVLADERYRKANMSDAAILEEFYSSGIADVNYLRAYLQRANLALTADMVAAEYGCGLGRVTPFLAEAVSRVIAFDISAPHLEAARRRVDERKLDNVDFIHVKDRSALQNLNGVDLFFSIIVLQHNPPPVILEILKTAFSGIRSGGVAFFQVPIYSSDYSFNLRAFMEKEAIAKSMEMHFLPQKDILQLASAHGMELMEVRTDNLVGNYDRWISNTFLFRKT